MRLPGRLAQRRDARTEYHPAVPFTPEDPAFIADPYPALAELRAGPAGVYDEASDHWLVPRWEDVNRILRDRRFGRTYLHVATHEEMGRTPPPEPQAPFWRVVQSGILDMEPPNHTRVRTLVNKAFSARMVEALREPVRRIMTRLADAIDGAGEVDLLATVAEPLPVEIIAELLGIPESDRHQLRPWSADICRMYELHPDEEDARVAVAAAREFSDYLRALARERQRAPREDLITALAQVAVEGERLTEDELVGTCVLLLNAGHEATVNTTGNGWWALFRNPDQLARLRADRSLVPTAVEELLRYEPSSPMFERWVLEDTEIGGVEGQGFYQVTGGLELGRINVAARGVGIAEGALELATGYAQTRKTFGKPICEHQAIQLKLGEMATRARAARLLTLDAAGAFDRGERCDLEAGMAKYFSTEAALENSIESMRIHGAYGYSKEYDIERLYRDAPLTVIGEGTNEIQRIIIAKQWLKRNPVA